MRVINEGQCSYGSDASSLPFTCTRATVPDSARFGQGFEGYDTSHDTKFLAHPDAAPGRELSSGEGVWLLVTPLHPFSHPCIFYFFFPQADGKKGAFQSLPSAPLRGSKVACRSRTQRARISLPRMFAPELSKETPLR